MICQILCDFDGTIALDDVTDRLLETYADPAWRDIEALWKSGAIGSSACMARQVALLDCSLADLDRLLDDIAIDPTFPAFVRFCEAARLPISIVSDGLDYAIARILRRHGLAHLPVLANALQARPARRYGLEFPHGGRDCAAGAGHCKCATSRRDPAFTGPTIVIGDGRSDFCVAASADFVFAKDALIGHCRDHGIPHRAFASFADIVPVLAQMAAGATLAIPPIRDDAVSGAYSS
jgi:2-hydroxy-3-keto-5-methylthiopentenyl-1-phosphate phosphatase